MPLITAQDIWRGLLIYPLGDTIAALISRQFNISRLIGMMLIGALLYAFEIPHYFNWLEKKIGQPQNFRYRLRKSALAALWFNPLWIARHLFFIYLFSGAWYKLNTHLIIIGIYSFIWNLPVSLSANYVIQNKLSLRWRFFASAVFSSLMAIYYALSGVWLQ